jgi:hypothetical protein
MATRLVEKATIALIMAGTITSALSLRLEHGEHDPQCRTYPCSATYFSVVFTSLVPDRSERDETRIDHLRQMV